MNLIYLVFGKKNSYHYEAIFSICSFLAVSKSVERVCIYTDAPEFYKHMGNKVTLCVVDEKQLEEWKGEYGFFWRVKIKAVEDAIQRYPGKITVYLDSDTFAYKSTSSFEQLLHSGNAFMHKQESLLSNSKSNTTTRMWHQMKGRTFSGITINEEHAMWNAGLIAIPVDKQTEAIHLSLQLCDDMCAANITPRLIEQLAFSLSLQETYSLFSSDDLVGHYWGNKDGWDGLISDYFAFSHLQNLTIDDEIDNLINFDFSQIPLVRRERNIYKRLNRCMKNAFPIRDTFVK